MNPLRNHLLLFMMLSIVAALVMLNSTTPEDVGPVGVSLFFGLVYLTSFFLVALVTRLIIGQNNFSLGSSRQFTMVSLIALVPPFALALQSLDQLVFRDVLILVFLSAMAIFYWIKRG